MTPAQLHAALAQMNPRAAQTLIFRCVENRSDAECAALYGVGQPQWRALYFEAARALVGEVSALPDSERGTLSPRLIAALADLTTHAEEVQRLRVEAEQAAAVSPARARETWTRRAAIALIIGVSLFVWLRERNAPPPHNPLPARKVG